MEPDKMDLDKLSPEQMLTLDIIQRLYGVPEAEALEMMFESQEAVEAEEQYPTDGSTYADFICIAKEMRALQMTYPLVGDDLQRVGEAERKFDA